MLSRKKLKIIKKGNFDFIFHRSIKYITKSKRKIVDRPSNLTTIKTGFFVLGHLNLWSELSLFSM